MALAKPGELLVSGTVKDLVAGSPIRFRGRRECELNGVPGRWSLHRVMDDERGDAAAARSAARRKGRTRHYASLAAARLI
jgi:class 3 adenylate cyclase